jgi:ribosomal protein S18 acetylase RimI-like enzyme
VNQTKEWSDLAERTEAVGMVRLIEDLAPEVRNLLGADTRTVGDGVHTIVSRDPMFGYWNKSLGFCKTVTDDQVAQVTADGTAYGVPVLALQLQPRVVPDDWSAIAERHGLVPGNVMVKFFGPATPREVETDLRIERLDASYGPEFARIMMVGFEVPQSAESAAMFGGAAYFEGDWSTYGAFSGDQLVGVARLLAVDETGAVHLFGAATLPEARKRGAQSALMDARIREARDRGLEWASAETWLESAEHQNPSQHNMAAAGLTAVHTRPNWVWRPVGQA